MDDYPNIYKWLRAIAVCDELGRGKTILVEVELNLAKIAVSCGKKAYRNKTGQRRLLNGAVIIRRASEEVQP